MGFYTYDPVYCPNCLPTYHRKNNNRIGVTLNCTNTNYSGCMVDFGECPKCKKRFQVRYKVDEVTEIKEQ